MGLPTIFWGNFGNLQGTFTVPFFGGRTHGINTIGLSLCVLYSGLFVVCFVTYFIWVLGGLFVYLLFSRVGHFTGVVGDLGFVFQCGRPRGVGLCPIVFNHGFASNSDFGDFALYHLWGLQRAIGYIVIAGHGYQGSTIGHWVRGLYQNWYAI